MKIRNAKGRRDNNSGYIRLFDNIELGHLFSKAQAAVISNGTELEKTILARTRKIADLDGFIDAVTDGDQPDGVYVCAKSAVKNSSLTVKGHEPDLLVFIVRKKRVCKIIELKDGDTFDTKKAKGEYENLKEFSEQFGYKIPFVTEFYVCCFNPDDKDAIVAGFKGAFPPEHVLTGREPCAVLNIDYDETVNARKADAADNINYFVDELLKIPAVTERIKEHYATR